ncbi:MAG: endonuclease III [Deltaproteobacteria bacterium]|nr:endonuclease III [Deltaproteobacteria bacterium]
MARSASSAGKSRARPVAAVPRFDGTVTDAVRERAAEIHRRLRKAQPSPQVELDHTDAWTLLVATILAARSNDRTINGITPQLFARWPTPADLAAAPQEQVEVVVKRSGFFRQKAAAIRKTAQAVVAEFGGEVPASMEELITLPGVARKTANVVLASVFRIGSGIIVDLHVTRIVERFGFTTDKDAKKIEALLCVLFPKRSWVDVGHRLVLHGRHVCTARKPRCGHCPLNEVCPSAADEPVGRWSARARWEQTLAESRGEVDTFAD